MIYNFYHITRKNLIGQYIVDQSKQELSSQRARLCGGVDIQRGSYTGGKVYKLGGVLLSKFIFIYIYSPVNETNQFISLVFLQDDKEY